MSLRKRYWKCPDCGETERREPHFSLGDHMHYRHGKAWSESNQRYEARLVETITKSVGLDGD